MNIVVIEGRRYDLDKCTDLDQSAREEHGVSRIGVWVTPKSKRVIVGTHSIWERGHTGRIMGDSYHFAEDYEIADLARETGDATLLGMLPEGD